MIYRPRRNRRNEAIRSLVRETRFTPEQLILPLFVEAGSDLKIPIASLPGVYRYSPENLVLKAQQAIAQGVGGIAIFPKIEDSLKDPTGSHSLDKNNVNLETVKRLKDALPDTPIFTDVALDPYSSDGHDGIL